MQALSNRTRWERAIVPQLGYGALIGGFSETDADPAQPGVSERLSANAFAVRTSLRTKATGTRSGYLYFTVNEVKSYDRTFPEMFSIDNLGTFYVKISVTSK